MCIGCHAIPGNKATFPEVFQVPKIGGQSAKYIEKALKGYQKGERKHPSMKGIAVRALLTSSLTCTRCQVPWS